MSSKQLESAFHALNISMDCHACGQASFQTRFKLLSEAKSTLNIEFFEEIKHCKFQNFLHSVKSFQKNYIYVVVRWFLCHFKRMKCLLVFNLFVYSCTVAFCEVLLFALAFFYSFSPRQHVIRLFAESKESQVYSRAVARMYVINQIG